MPLQAQKGIVTPFTLIFGIIIAFIKLYVNRFRRFQVRKCLQFFNIYLQNIAKYRKKTAEACASAVFLFVVFDTLFNYFGSGFILLAVR